MNIIKGGKEKMQNFEDIKMLSFKQFILQEELNDRQKSVVRGWSGSLNPHNVKSEMAEQISKHIIPPGRHSLIIPVSHPETHRKVEEHLKQHEIDIVDYERGLGKDSYGRSVKLGRALTKTKAPKGLITNPTPKAARVAKNAAVGFSFGKNWVAIIGARLPKI
jgi:hypothetical protein